MRDRLTTAEQTRSGVGPSRIYCLLLDRGDSVSSPGSLPRPDRPPKAAPSLIVRIDFVRARLPRSGQPAPPPPPAGPPHPPPATPCTSSTTPSPRCCRPTPTGGSSTSPG